MKIAIIAPVIRKISQKNLYGGIERIIASLAIGAAEAGHKVTLYAPFGTDLVHDNLTISFSTITDISGLPGQIRLAEEELFKRIIIDQDQFDIIHTHIEPIVAKYNDDNYFRQIHKPIVVTFHNQTHIDENIAYYKSHQELHKINFVFISHNQAKPLNFLTNKTVIYNGINLDNLSFNNSPTPNQLAFLGRITPEKGIAEAIAITKNSGKKLLIGAAIDKTQLAFFENKIKPQIDNTSIVFLGEINEASKNELLGQSEALLFPIKWHEPFGLVVVEAMATGTPVVATDMGSMSEIIQDGITGFILPINATTQDYTDKLSQIKNIHREDCRKTVQEKFTDTIMVANYLKYYDTLI